MLEPLEQTQYGRIRLGQELTDWAPWRSVQLGLKPQVQGIVIGHAEQTNDRPNSMIDLFITLPPHYIECFPYTLAQIDKPTMSLNLLEHKLDSNELVIPLSIVSLENYLHCEP